MDFQVELQVMMEITSKIQQEVEPLVGLEYLAYVIDKLSNPYFCLLCNKTGSWENIIAHFKSVNHRKRYLVSKHPDFKLENCSILKKSIQISNIKNIIEYTFRYSYGLH